MLLNPNGVLMLIGRIWAVMDLPRLLFQGEETIHSGGPRRQKRLKDWLDDPNRGVAQKFEVLYEVLSKKHAMEFAKFMQQYEEVNAEENETNDEDDAKDKEWKNKIEETLSLMKKLQGGPLNRR